MMGALLAVLRPMDLSKWQTASCGPLCAIAFVLAGCATVPTPKTIEHVRLKDWKPSVQVRAIESESDARARQVGGPPTPWKLTMHREVPR
jgi:hypothetical protein